MTNEMTDLLDDWHGRLKRERDMRTRLAAAGAPKVTDLKFRKQSHNATVFEARLDGAPVFLKRYETDYGLTLTRNGVTETAIVREQMDGTRSGIVDILWSSEAEATVLMSAAPGRPVAEALSDGKAAQMMPQVAQWLADYIGPRRFQDKFSTSHWVNTRGAEDVSALSARDYDLSRTLLDLQRNRKEQFGTLPACKGNFPKDFAPHNLHWTGDAIWGFDIEGYSTNPVARAIARFCVLAERRIPPDGARRFGVNAICLDAFDGAFDLSGDHPALMPFLIADELLSSLHRRHDDPVAGPAVRRAIESHLTSAHEI